MDEGLGDFIQSGFIQARNARRNDDQDKLAGEHLHLMRLLTFHVHLLL